MYIYIYNVLLFLPAWWSFFFGIGYYNGPLKNYGTVDDETTEDDDVVDQDPDDEALQQEKHTGTIETDVSSNDSSCDDVEATPVESVDEHRIPEVPYSEFMHAVFKSDVHLNLF